nr:MAG TPA: hypothetical protein [Microviridae sp.]
MKIQIKLKSGSRIVTKTVEVSAPTILSLLSVKSTQEIYKKLCVSPFEDIDGYVISIVDKD